MRRPLVTKDRIVVKLDGLAIVLVSRVYVQDRSHVILERVAIAMLREGV